MKRFSNWLGADLSGLECLGFSLVALLVGAVITSLASMACSLMGYEAISETSTRLFVETPGLAIYITAILVVPMEEAVFRLIPAALTLWLAKEASQSARVNALVIVLGVSAVLFALTHGGSMNLLVHTPFGLVFGLIFLRCGGGVGKISRGYFFAVAVHLIYSLVAVWHVRATA